MSEKWKSVDPQTLPGHYARRFQQIAVAYFNAEISDLGLTPVQYVSLHAIYQQPGIDQRTLARSISYDAATIGGVIDRLETRGLVLRESNPDDRRVRLIRLTPAGLQTLKKAIPLVLRAQEHMLKPLSATERKEFMRLFARVVDGASDVEGTGEAD